MRLNNLAPLRGKNEMKKYFTIALLLATFASNAQLQALKISANKRYFQTKDGKPFFWLGDTGWLFLKNVKRKMLLNILMTESKKALM